MFQPSIAPVATCVIKQPSSDEVFAHFVSDLSRRIERIWAHLQRGHWTDKMAFQSLRIARSMREEALLHPPASVSAEEIAKLRGSVKTGL